MRMHPPERDAALSAAYVAVAVAGLFLTVAAGVALGARTMAGVGIGVVLALGNLWALEWLVGALLAGEKKRLRWLALLKVALLFGAVALLVHRGLLDVLPLLAGFGCLPLGAVLAGARPTSAVSTEES